MKPDKEKAPSIGVLNGSLDKKSIINIQPNNTKIKRNPLPQDTLNELEDNALHSFRLTFSYLRKNRGIIDRGLQDFMMLLFAQEKHRIKAIRDWPVCEVRYG